MGVFNAIGTIFFAYGGHNVALEIQATIPVGGKNGNSSVPAMMKGEQQATPSPFARLSGRVAVLLRVAACSTTNPLANGFHLAHGFHLAQINILSQQRF